MSESNDLYEQNLESPQPSIDVLVAEFRAYEVLSEIDFEIESDQEIESY